MKCARTHGDLRISELSCLELQEHTSKVHTSVTQLSGTVLCVSFISCHISQSGLGFFLKKTNKQQTALCHILREGEVQNTEPTSNVITSAE